MGDPLVIPGEGGRGGPSGIAGKEDDGINKYHALHACMERPPFSSYRRYFAGVWFRCFIIYLM